MNGLEEVPKYVRYDFLITLLGLISIGSWWYFTNVVKIESLSVNLLFVTGLFLVIWGFGEMYSNYEEEKNLRQLQIILEKKEIFNKLESGRMIDKDKKEFLVNSLKDDIDEIIEMKKES